MNLKALREERGKLQAEIDGLIKTCEKEGRDLTATENLRCQHLHVQDVAVQMRIEAEERGKSLPGPSPIVGGASHGGGNSTSPIIRRGKSVLPYLESRGLIQDRYEGLTFSGFIRSMVHGPKSAVERRALNETSDSAGGYTVPTVLLGQLIDRLRKKATIFRAGAVTVPLTTEETNLAVLATDPVAGWRSENEPVSEANPTFSRVQFKAKTLACMVKASRELLDDSVNVESALMNAFGQSLGLELDRVGLLGSGSDPEPRGITNTGDVGLVELNGSMDSYSPFVAVWQALADANANEPTAAIMAPRTVAELANLYAGTDGQPLQRPVLLQNLPFLSTTQIPVELSSGGETKVIVGDFTQLFVGIRTDLRIEVLKERYADNLQYGFLAWLRADCAVAHPESFCVIEGIVPPGGSE